MPIKWDPTLVNEALDRMEALLLETYPILEDAAREGKASVKIPNLPQYMTQPLEHLVENLQHAVDRSRRQMADTRGKLPDTPVARTVATRDRPGLF